MKTQVNTTQRKTKANNQQKSNKNPMQKRIHGYEMIINNNKKNLKQKKELCS
jgi:hypothetical protein